MGTKKKRPGLELPAVIQGAVLEYLGPRIVNELDEQQGFDLGIATMTCARDVQRAITPRDPSVPIPRDGVKAVK